MEERNNKSGIFLGVVGVATLVVAIIGATFAYFSASATANGDPITGNTLDLANALTLEVEKITFTDATAASNDLVPADLTPDEAGITRALTANCEDAGYTGCHLYKITATSNETVQAASIKLKTLTVDSTDDSKWAYAIYEGSETTATKVDEDEVGYFDGFTEVDMHDGAGLTGDTPQEYYLLIYLENINASQNNSDASDATGTYTGTVTFTAGTGSVSASFAA